jgi:hypothetical protein
MNDEDKRQWAIEQAIKLHAANGVATDLLLPEAEKLLKFIAVEKTEQAIAR